MTKYNVNKSTLALLLFLMLTSSFLWAQRKPVYSPTKVPDTLGQKAPLLNPCADLKARREDKSAKALILGEAMLADANQDAYDVRYYGINLSIDFGTEWIQGYVDYKIVALTNGFSAIDLNLHDDLQVASVTVNGAPAVFSHFNGLLMITSPEIFSSGEEFSMRVNYQGHPVSGYGYTDGGMGFMNNGGYDVCWTATEPWGSRNWWPCKDTPSDKADSIDLYIERSDIYTVASNGVLVSDDDLGNGRKRAHWKHNYPIVTYLVAITIAQFVVEEQTWNWEGYSMPVYSFTLPNAYDSRLVFDTLTIPMLNNYSEAFCVYPFVNEKLANANCGVYGTMEHQTCSFHDPFAYYYDNVYLLIHENAHQWWGDMITCEKFNDIWLNEGFGTWSEAIFFEKQFGKQAYFDRVQQYKYLGGGTIYVENVLTDVIFDGNLSYAKASWVPHMLRGMLGDTVFFQFISDWANSPFKYGTATTEDFSDVLSSSVGEDMSWYVNEWIYGEGHPGYRISWECAPDTGNGYLTTYVIEQTQTGGTYFTMPIQTIFQTTGGPVDTTIFNSGAIQIYSLWFPDSVTDVVVDPQEWILRTVEEVPLQLHVATTSLPNGRVGEPYWQKLRGVGGVPPYTWTFHGGDIPWGLTFEGDTMGVLSGTPDLEATYFFTIDMHDSDSPPTYTSQSFRVQIDESQIVIAGDADGSGVVNITDAVYLISFIFGGGPAPDPLSRGDADCNGIINISDAVFLIAYIFGGGDEPSCP